MFESLRRGLVLVILCLLFSPIVILIKTFFTPIIFELSSHYLNRVIGSTVVLVFLVTLFSTLIGTALACLCALYRFPGSKIFSWSLFLPFAAPPYVLAFVHVGFWSQYFSTHSIYFAAGILSLALYPYVFLFSRAAFLSQGRRVLEVAQSLGRSNVNAFFKVMIPTSWPWITSGALFVVMETLSDFGAVSIFNIDTISVAIYKSWFSYFSLPTAIRLSGITVLIVSIVLVLEGWTRRKRQFYTLERTSTSSEKTKLRGFSAVLSTSFCLTILSLGFIFPLFQLFHWTIGVTTIKHCFAMIPFIKNSLVLSSIATLIIVSLAMFIALSSRLERKYPKLLSLAQKCSSIGYALPGAVLAVTSYSIVQSVSLFRNTILMVLLGYLVRFMSVGLNPINTGLKRLSKNIDNAARSLGCRAGGILKTIYLPNIKFSLFTASLLVFIEVMKEMPITLMTRPYGWDTLSIKIFEFTSEGEWEKAAFPAIILLFLGIIPSILLSKSERSKT